MVIIASAAGPGAAGPRKQLRRQFELLLDNAANGAAHDARRQWICSHQSIELIEQLVKWRLSRYRRCGWVGQGTTRGVGDKQLSLRCSMIHV